MNEKMVDIWNKQIDRFWLVNLVIFAVSSASLIIFNYQASYDPNKLLLRGSCIFGLIFVVKWIAFNIRMQAVINRTWDQIARIEELKPLVEGGDKINASWARDFMIIAASTIGIAWLFLLKFTWSL